MTGTTQSLEVVPQPNGVPAFLNDTPYTVEFTLARKASDTIAFTTKVSGGGTNWSQ